MPPLPRPTLAPTLTLLLVLTIAPALRAQQIDAIASGSGQCFARSDFGEDSFISTSNIVSQMCDAVFISGSDFGQSISSVRVLFNATPFADTITFAEAVNGVGSTVRSNAQAELTYLSTTRFIDGIAPPFIPGQLPLRVSAPWAIAVDGPSGTIGSIRLTILDSDGAVFFSDIQTRTSGNDTDEYVLFGAPAPEEPFTITIESTCASVAPEDGESFCQAVIDPLIVFDQPTFDATWGASSYALSDFWEIDQSPNLLPEPSFPTFLAIGVLGLGLALPRRRASELARRE